MSDSPFIRLPVQNPLRLLVSRHGRPFFVPLHPCFDAVREAAEFELVAYVRQCHVGPDGALICDPPGEDVSFQIDHRVNGPVASAASLFACAQQ